MLVLLIGGLYHIQIVEGQKYRQMAQGNRERIIIKKADRGIIYDRNGKRLVVNNPSYSIAVAPAQLHDINCATNSVEGAQVFEELVAVLNANNVPVRDVITLRPAELPPDKAGEVANRLSVLLNTHADNLRGPIGRLMANNAHSRNPHPVRTDVPPEAARAVRAQLDKLPGIGVYNELELNFITRFDNCLKPVIVKRGIDYNTMQVVEAASARLPGVSVVPEPVRYYADGPLFSHILGYVGPITREQYESADGLYEPDDKVGQTGIEASMEEHLRGTKGMARVIVNAEERIVGEISSRAPITGNNVTLTIDSDLQRAVTAALQDGITKAKVKSGVAIVMRVDDGQVLAMVSLPSYDNNLFSVGISQADFDRLNTDPTLPMFNRAIGGAYPPGSTYKMITAAAALQEGVIRQDTTFFCPGVIYVPYTWDEAKRNPYRDWKAQGHGVLNVVQALAVSSDVFFYIVAGPRQEDRRILREDGTEQIMWLRYYTPAAKQPIEFNGLGIERLHRYAQLFGMGRQTGIELPGESPGLAPNPEWKRHTYPGDNWSLGDTLVTAIGQGFTLVTPLQLVNATAAVANGGTLYRPQLVYRVTDWSGNVVEDYRPEVLTRLPISAENLAIVREGMRQAVADKKGTAYYRMSLRSVSVAGKTGTAEYGEPIAVRNGKEVRRAHAWFTAFAPYEKPEIAVVVLLEGGEESLEGSTYAVPVADAILKAYFKVDK
jgi:penicillin-binding protein 2